eukprot:scaffold48624_cov63-Phaeocystis_antarctica.AAC.2
MQPWGSQSQASQSQGGSQGGSQSQSQSQSQDDWAGMLRATQDLAFSQTQDGGGGGGGGMASTYSSQGAAPGLLFAPRRSAAAAAVPRFDEGTSAANADATGAGVAMAGARSRPFRSGGFSAENVRENNRRRSEGASQLARAQKARLLFPQPLLRPLRTRLVPSANQPALPRAPPPPPRAAGVQAAQLPHRRDARRGHQACRPARAPGAARAARPAHRQGRLRAAVARRRRRDAHGQRRPREAARRRQGTAALAAGLLRLRGVPARAGAQRRRAGLARRDGGGRGAARRHRAQERQPAHRRAATRAAYARPRGRRRARQWRRWQAQPHRGCGGRARGRPDGAVHAAAAGGALPRAGRGGHRAWPLGRGGACGRAGAARGGARRAVARRCRGQPRAVRQRAAAARRVGARRGARAQPHAGGASRIAAAARPVGGAQAGDGRQDGGGDGA